MPKSIKDTIADFYLEFLNNWLTIERYAEHHGITIDQCKILGEMGRQFHNERTDKVFGQTE